MFRYINYICENQSALVTFYCFCSIVMVEDLSPVSFLALASVADLTGDYHKLHQGDYTRNRAAYNGSYFLRYYGEIHSMHLIPQCFIITLAQAPMIYNQVIHKVVPQENTSSMIRNKM